MNELVDSLRLLAVRALARMFAPQQQMFVFRLRKDGQTVISEGLSRRYTAIVLLALARESRSTADQVLSGHSPQEVCLGLLRELPAMDELGEVALTLWAAKAVGLPAEKVTEQLSAMWNQRAWPTVETSWALSALYEGADGPTDSPLARQIAQRLLESYHHQSSLFAHWTDCENAPAGRRHVTCFADFVYPVQALSCYAQATGSQQPLDVASQCATRMCQLQGADGQWWWHFDVRTGRLVENYPVYSVHQDAMAPMALRAVLQAGGPDLMSRAELGLKWLAHVPELNGSSLIDTNVDLVWRKVARHEPGKLARGLQAAVSSIHPALRVPGLGMLLRPGYIDYETRPYHMGWILYAWPARQAAAAREKSPSVSASQANSLRSGCA